MSQYKNNLRENLFFDEIEVSPEEQEEVVCESWAIDSRRNPRIVEDEEFDEFEFGSLKDYLKGR